MRKLALIMFACLAPVLGGVAQAQELSIAASGSTLFSTNSYSSSAAYPQPPEKGGVYPGVNVEYVFENHFGLNVESSFRYHEALYDGYQKYRPVLTDVNGVFAPRTGPRTVADFMAGVGLENVNFYNQFGSCSGICPNFVSSHHFLFHGGAGVRYYFWRNFFARPEAHYYYIIGNTDEFHSGSVLRLGASIGYTFGRPRAPRKQQPNP